MLGLVTFLIGVFDMSVIQLYSMQDNAAKNFFPPFPARTHEHAARGFSDAIANRENPLFGQYPDHFDLYHVGTMDEDTGVLEGFERPRMVLTGRAVAEARGLRSAGGVVEPARPLTEDPAALRLLADEVLNSRNQEL